MGTVSHTYVTDPQLKTPWTLRPGEFLRPAVFCATWYHVPLLGKASTVHVSTGREQLEVCCSLCWALPCVLLIVTFPFPVINRNCECNRLSESVSPSRLSPNLQVVLGLCSPASSLSQTPHAPTWNAQPPAPPSPLRVSPVSHASMASACAVQTSVLWLPVSLPLQGRGPWA